MQVTDPVCGMQIESDKAAANETVQGQTYYFCSESCHSQFQVNPDHYTKKGRSRESAGTHCR